MKEVRTALLSVYDKTGLVEFATALAARGVRLVSTGGTARHLREADLEVTEIDEITGAAEMLDGRVKTLHPNVFGGILARREDESQMAELQEAGIAPIDLVAVNLYPFEETVAGGPTLIEALEKIDIGGVSLLRAAAKNFPGVIVASDPEQYPAMIAALDVGGPTLPTRLSWAHEAFARTAVYDAAIGNYTGAIDPDALAVEQRPELGPHPRTLGMSFRHVQALRYGENPHQRAAFYAGRSLPDPGLTGLEQLQGKELSFNNLLDLDAAWQLAWALESPGAAVIKHANPCGAAVGETIRDAYVRARSTDPTSAFGGIVGLNAPVDGATAEEIAATFIEVVVAPDFDEAARERLGAKENLRLIRLGAPTASYRSLPDLRFVSGGLLVQDRDWLAEDGGAEERWEVVSERQPTPQEERDLRFCWSVIPAVRSNAILIGRDGRLLGVGAGQMSRVDSCRFAAFKARDAGHELAGSSAASDAFFPFPDGVESLAEAGVTAIVQPGGSRRDPEVIEAADRLGLALVHTGVRHFRH